MRILSKGPSPPKNWYVGKILLCRECGARLALTEDDKTLNIARGVYPGDFIFKFECPCCVSPLPLRWSPPKTAPEREEEPRFRWFWEK